MNIPSILLGIGGGLVVLTVMAIIKIGFTAWAYSAFNKGGATDAENNEAR